MAKDIRKAPHANESKAPVKSAPAKSAGSVSKSMARHLKNEWRRAKKNGDRRSLKVYAADTDGGPGWLANKKA